LGFFGTCQTQETGKKKQGVLGKYPRKTQEKNGLRGMGNGKQEGKK